MEKNSLSFLMTVYHVLAFSQYPFTLNTKTQTLFATNISSEIYINRNFSPVKTHSFIVKDGQQVRNTLLGKQLCAEATDLINNKISSRAGNHVKIFSIKDLNNAQINQYILKGKLVEDGKPLQFAAVNLKNESGVILSTAFSDHNGDFKIMQRNGTYILEIKIIGRLLLSKSIILNSNTDLGTLNLNSSFNLSEVQIVGAKKILERKIDRLVFNVDGNIPLVDGNAVDVLKITPNLIVSDQSVSMVGKNEVTLMVNDKQIKLRGSDLANYLKSIPASNISKIEIISIPPAKYDAEGNSGLVNIVLKKNKQNFYNGSVNASYAQSRNTTGSVGGNLNFQKDKWSAVSSVNYTNGSSSPFQNYKIHYRDYIWDEDKESRIYKNELSANVSLDYSTSKKTNFGIEYAGLNSKPIISSINQSSVYARSTNSLDSTIVTPATINASRNSNTINFYTTTKLDTLGKSMYFEANYFSYITETDNKFTTSVYLSDGISFNDRRVSANNISAQTISIYTSKLDFEMPLKLVSLSFGAKVSSIKNNSNIQYFNTLSSIPILEENKSNSFEYLENTQSAYFTANRRFKNDLEIKIGLRNEYTQISASPFATNQKYNQVFPSLFLAYPIGSYYLTLGYNKRINRPSYRNLNPFRYYSTANNYTEGNPLLIPYFSNNIELSLSSNKLVHTIYYTSTKNSIDEVTITNSNSTTQKTRPINFLTSKTFGISEYFIFDKFKNWRSNLSINVFHTEAISFVPEIRPRITAWTGYLFNSNSFVMNKGKNLTAELNIVYQTPNIANSYKSSAFFNMDTGIKYAVLKKKLILSLMMNDIFRSSGVTFNNVVNGITQNKYSYNDAQRIRFQITYNFGKELKINKKKASEEENRKRIR
ncbi:outer membrane beta-barrel protein [Pedobacter sp.]|uniref:outer membrane beta-barrel protein n=1 Tax=Pedobacter sp. TaxID=1411316 RepID=UPI003BA8A2CF